MIQNDRQQLTNRILRFGRQIRGTPQFWFSKRQQLIAMINQLGSASFFFTFSVADTRWPDLLRFIVNDDNVTTAEAIARSPLTVDSYVMLRFQIFFDTFLKPYLDITDFWFRIEWQSRGSLHIHGLAWTDNLPDSTTCAEQDITDFWNKYVNSWNPALNFEDNPVDFFWQVDRHPCSIPLNEIDVENLPA